VLTEIGTKKEVYEDQKQSNMFIPEWWREEGVHSRIPRGAIAKYMSAKNSMLSNFHNGNCKRPPFTRFKTKKDPIKYIHFDDGQYPVYFRNMKSRWWYTTRDRKRVALSLSDIIEQTKKGSLECIYEEHTNRFFLHVPVPRDWIPTNDKRVDNQESLKVYKNRIIALDPGIRKFMVGFDPISRISSVFGDSAKFRISSLLLELDKLTDSTSKFLYWNKIKNLVDELHWKTINYLIENYDTILLPEFRIQQMISKRKLSRLTKRLMCMFSFHRFRERLAMKCSQFNKQLIIVNEAYTSCTCTRCGIRKKSNGMEIFTCKNCGLVIDRDTMGARNILLKYITEHIDAGYCLGYRFLSI
jgi:putative transposase